MTTALRRAMLLAAVFVVPFTPATSTSAGSVSVIASVDEPSTTEPPATEPPETEPPATEPPAETDPPSTETAPGEGGSDVDTTVTVIGVLAFVGLIGVAAWWMVRRRDDDEPHPPAPRFDDPLPGRDLI